MTRTSPISDDSPSLKGWPLFGIALFLVIVWGSAFTMIGVAVRTISPDWLVAFRMTIGAALVFAYCKSRGYGLPPLNDKRWFWYCSLGLTGASLPFVLIAIGQKTVDSGLTAIIVGAMPLITIILAHFFTEEKLTRWKLLGFSLGFAGIVILFLPKELSLELVQDWKAQLLILTGSFFYAVTAITASRAPETHSAVGAAMMLMMGALLSTAWALSQSGVPTLPTGAALFCVLALGVGSTGISTVVFLWVIDVAGPSVMARINYFVPVCSVIFGVWLLGEVLDWRIFVSLFVIVFGVIISKIGNAD